MYSGGVTVTIIGVDVDAAVDPILTLFNGSNSAGSGVSETFLNTELHIKLFIYVLHTVYTLTFAGLNFCRSQNLAIFTFFSQMLSLSL